MYRIIFSDIDGTLLHDDLSIGEKTKTALKRAEEKGLVIAIASGRYLLSLDMLEKMIGIPLMKIGINGAVIEYGGKRIYEERIDRDAYITATSYLYRKASSLITFSSRSYAIDANEEWRTKQTSILKDAGVHMDIRDYDGVEASLGEKPFKILVKDRDQEKLDRMEKELSEILGSTASVSSSGRGNIEVMPPGITKADGLKKAGELLNISQDEMIAFGDWDNDADMLAWAGMGIAMANASEKARKNARMITLSNNEDGIAAALEKLGI